MRNFTYTQLKIIIIYIIIAIFYVCKEQILISKSKVCNIKRFKNIINKRNNPEIIQRHHSHHLNIFKYSPKREKTNITNKQN